MEGIDDREGHSPSFFNKKEIEIVVEYVENLLDKRGGRKIKESDIGVITPYRRQVCIYAKFVLRIKTIDFGCTLTSLTLTLTLAFYTRLFPDFCEKK